MTTAYELSRCPVCTHGESRQIADADGIRAEVELLWEFHERRLRPGTPPERLVDRVAFSQRPALRVAQCERCGTVYRNPRERAFELHETYATDAPGPAAMCALLATQRAAFAAQARRLTDVAASVGVRPGQGLEVGSYLGGFLDAAVPHGWHFEGVDVNPAVNAFTRARGFVVHDGTVETVRRANLAAVAIWNCLDQLDDPQATVAGARRLVREGGLIALRVPNGGFYAALRARLSGALAPIARALLAHNNLLGFPYRQAFAPDSLRLLLRRNGFQLIHLTGDVLVPIADEWTRRWARLEERALKRLLRLTSASTAAGAPWLEAYGRASTRGRSSA